MFLTILALGTLIVVLAIAVELSIGLRSLGWLHDQPVERSPALPRVSIIVAARNEEKNILSGLSSLLKLDYPNKQVIVVNDRSTDGTGRVLSKAMINNPSLLVTTISDLPKGWLGKNYAQYTGAQVADGEILLFTDADIVMDPTVLRRAVPFIQRERIDHLAIGPKAQMPGIMLNLFMAGFAVFFNIFSRPWRAKNPKSKAHIGIGAFNLIRKEVYEKIGTHEAIAMRPDDDIKLGKLVKKFGFRQDFLLGTDMIFVEWYDSVRALVDGLMKNSFSGVNYSLAAISGATIGQLVFGVWPFVAPIFVAAPAKWFFLAGAIIQVVICGAAARAQKISWLYGLGFPLACLMFLYIIWKATLRTLLRGGIEWRGTFYPLSELRKNVV